MAAEALQPLAARARLMVLPLHGDLPSAAQTRAVQPADQRKIILSTNVAESSVTIPGIAAVVDSGLARVSGHSSWSGLPMLSLAKISKASAIQRAGRAGRTQHGRVLRLYTRHDFESRPEQDLPEIRRADLAESVLTLHGAGVTDMRAFRWFEPPADAALCAAEDLLIRLGALETSGMLTETGRKMLRYPLHPRLARLIVEGEKLGVADSSCLIAALLSERDIRIEQRSSSRRSAASKGARSTGPSDLIELLDRFREAEAARFEPNRLRSLDLDPRAVESVERARRQLVRFVRPAGKNAQAGEGEEALMIAVLAAFPDRVARRRAAGAREFLLAAGGAGRLADGSVVHQAPLIVAVDAEERTGRKGTRDSAGVLIRLASGIEPEWLAGLYPEKNPRRIALAWNGDAGRVEEANQTLYGDLVLEETVRPAMPSDDVSRILLTNALAHGLASFRDHEQIPVLRARIALLAEHSPAAGFLSPRRRADFGCLRGMLFWKAQPRRACPGIADRRAGGRADFETKGSFAEGNSGAHRAAARPQSSGPLRTRASSLDRIRTPGFPGHEVDSGDLCRACPAHGPSPGPQPTPGASYTGPARLLGKALPGTAPPAPAPIPQALLA